MTSLTSSFYFGSGIFAIGLGAVLIIIGVTAWSIGDIFRENAYENSIKIPIETEIDFKDHESLKDWMERAEITNTSDIPLAVGETIWLRAIVDSPNPPKELVAHIYHEDVDDFFTSEDDPSGFRQITKELNRVPTLRYGSIFHIDFDMKKYWKCTENSQNVKDECNYLPQTKEKGVFTESGKYFVQFSAKLDDNVFDHRKSPMALTTIKDPKDIWLEEQVRDIKFGALLQSADSKNNIGVAFTGIGVGMIFSGLALIRPEFQRKNV